MTSLTELAFDDLTSALRRGTQIDIAQLDRIDTYVDADPSQFPSTFLAVLKNRSSSPTPDYVGEVVHRLRSILDAHKSTTVLGLIKSTEPGLLPLFVLADDEKERISKLCSQLRKIVHASTDFDQPHKVRLLNRVAAIEVEAQKPKGMFDVLLGGMSDFGETLGKFGADSKPIFDRMSEIVKIGRSKTKDYDQLPPPEDVKKLPAPDKSDDDVA